MAGTLKGGKAAAQTNRERHGKDFYQRLGALGGKAKVPKGFARMDKDYLSMISSKGGKNSRRLK